MSYQKYVGQEFEIMFGGIHYRGDCYEVRTMNKVPTALCNFSRGSGREGTFYVNLKEFEKSQEKG